MISDGYYVGYSFLFSTSHNIPFLQQGNPELLSNSGSIEASKSMPVHVLNSYLCYTDATRGKDERILAMLNTELTAAIAEIMDGSCYMKGEI